MLSSSACAYNILLQQDPKVRALKESDAYPAMPERGYGWEKLLSEIFCQEYCAERALKTFIARFHNVYGPHGTWDGGREKAPAAICRKVVEAMDAGNREIEVWGDGNQMAGPASLQTYHGAYFQDDIKLTKKLTINAGIRWDFEPPRVERYNRQVFWDRNYTWTWKPDPGWSWSQVEQAVGRNLAQPDWITKGIHGRAAPMGTPAYPMQTLEESHPDHFGPRLGAAYQILPRTVIRASYGIIWLTKTGNWHLSTARWNTGYGDSARLAQGGTPDGGLPFPSASPTPCRTIRVMSL